MLIKCSTNITKKSTTPSSKSSYILTPKVPRIPSRGFEGLGRFQFLARFFETLFKIGKLISFWDFLFVFNQCLGAKVML